MVRGIRHIGRQGRRAFKEARGASKSPPPGSTNPPRATMQAESNVFQAPGATSSWLNLTTSMVNTCKKHGMATLGAASAISTVIGLGIGYRSHQHGKEAKLLSQEAEINTRQRELERDLFKYQQKLESLEYEILKKQHEIRNTQNEREGMWSFFRGGNKLYQAKLEGLQEELTALTAQRKTLEEHLSALREDLADASENITNLKA